MIEELYLTSGTACKEIYLVCEKAILLKDDLKIILETLLELSLKRSELEKESLGQLFSDAFRIFQNHFTRD